MEHRNVRYSFRDGTIPIFLFKIDNIGDWMKEDFARLTNAVDTNTLPPPSGALAIYHSFDLLRDQCDCTSALTFEGPVLTNLNKPGENPEPELSTAIYVPARDPVRS